MNPQKEMEQFSERLYDNFIRPSVKEDLQNGNLTNGASPVGCFRATVTQALTNGKLTVQRPFDTETLELTPVASMQSAAVDSQVLVLVFGSGGNAANAIVFAYTDFSNL